MNEDAKVPGRLFSGFEVQLCADPAAPGLVIAGEKLVPDDSKAYLAFTISYAAPARTAYGTMLHPGTVANSFASMRHQVFNLSHLMRAYDTSPDRKEIARDYTLGTVVGVELTQTQAPFGGWQYTTDPAKSTAIRGVAVLHKNAERVPKILGEHLAGRKKWTVSMEVEYSLGQSGFVISNRAQANKAAEELMAAHTPADMTALGLGYVPCPEAPEELFACYAREKRRIAKNWMAGGAGKGLPVSLLKGGINGQVHYYGVGLVSVGAEREAEVERILAGDPDAIDPEDYQALLAYYRKSAVEANNLLTALAKFVPQQT